jgi:prepilin-type N-terminal cleavage/methylation domain-containing protein
MMTDTATMFHNTTVVQNHLPPTGGQQMQYGSKTRDQQGFTLFELMVVFTILTVFGLALTTLLQNSLKFTFATYQMTDAQESLRTAQEIINRDLLNAGDGLKTLSTIRLPKTFVQTYLTRVPVEDPASPGIINLGIITSDNDVTTTAVPLASPATTYADKTDRQTIVEIDSSFTQVTLPSSPASIDTTGGTITVPAPTAMSNFRAGEIYFLTSADGGTFGTITSVDATNRKLNFANGDTYGLNLTGTGGHIKTISSGGTLAASLQRMKIIHYYVNFEKRLMRRVFGAKCSPAPAVCAGFRESPVAEHIVNVQFTYSMATTDATGNVVPSTGQALTTSDQQIAVRQVEVKVTAETPKELQNRKRQAMSNTTSTSIRNMQFREALQP